MGKNIIEIKGARSHNLKNIDLNIPREKFVVFTGVSGSGKSSLAFDTIYAEGQRRYVESLSSYARPVSYTHLDVYKRQVFGCLILFLQRTCKRGENIGKKIYRGC